MTPDVIMEIVNEHWNMDGIENGQYVPKFQQVCDKLAQVRVKFKSKLGIQRLYSAIKSRKWKSVHD